jgi:transposase
MADEAGTERKGTGGAPRIITANRAQLQLRPLDLESLLAPEHRARAVWAVVEQLDLSAFYDAIAARGSEPGRPAIDPKILVALWLYATSEGVGSARELARLCEAHDAYRWLCGGVAVNHHTLSDFRVGHEAALDALMTQVLAVLLRQGLVTLTRVAQDGTRVRASAGASSFRREKSLRACLEAAQAHVERVKQEAEHPPAPGQARAQAAAARAARERAQRVARALAELPKAQATKRDAAAKAEARVSTTDPEARVMKMGDGGYRPAYNLQFATATEGRVIVGVQVTNAGTDMGQMRPMQAEIARRTGEQPAEYLVDGGFAKLEAIEEASAAGTTVYAPVPTPRRDGVEQYQPKPGDSAAIAAWRTRMGTDAARAIYKERAATAETVHGDLRTWRGLDRLPVRGSAKVLSIALWAAVTYNVLRWIAGGAGG